MTSKRTVLDRVADRVMDLESPAYGDERERAVFMEASSFGLTTGHYFGLLIAVVAAIFGLVLLPVVVLIMAMLPSAAAMWYAKRRNVGIHKLADKSGARSTLINIIVYGAGAVLTFAFMSYTVFAGQPLLSMPSIDVTPGEGFVGGLAQGAVVGGMIGGLAAIIGGVVSFRRVNRRRDAREG